MDTCPECGTEVDQGAARCSSCQAPLVGEPRRAPKGSSPPLPETGTHARRWNVAVWVGMLVVLGLAVMLALR